MKSRDYKHRLISIISMVVTAILSAAPITTNAQNYPSGFSQTLITKVSLPTNMAFAPDGRIFICEQTGKLRVVKNGKLLSRPFITLSVDARDNRGLLGVALHPSFATNQWVYLFYTRSNQVNNRIIRVKASGDTAVRSTMQTVLDLDTLTINKNRGIGGTIKFGADGKLYIGSGYNETGVGEPPYRSQNLNTNLGKLLRINPDGSAPADNPYPNGSSEQKKQIWCYGIKTPYTFDIERGTGRIFVNDVGEHTWEEINDATVSNRNFGWPYAEGNSTNPDYTNPLYAYNHSGDANSTGCAISGGAFLSATSNYPQEYKDNYYFTDVCGGWINRITYKGSVVRRTFATNLGSTKTGVSGYSVIALTCGVDGNLYYLSRLNGGLYKITYSNTLIAKTEKGTEKQLQTADLLKKILLYPSPAGESITIELMQFKTTNNVINIYDGKGMLVKSIRIAGTKTTINTSTFANGIYHVMINDGSAIIKEKFEVNH